MLEPDVLTIVAPLKPGTEDATREFIRSRIDPGWLSRDERHLIPPHDGADAESDTGMRLGDLRFNDFPGLHCCAFIVVDGRTKPGFFGGDKELPPYLIMEATIDSTAQDFISDLVDQDAVLVSRIFEHCEGFPQNAGSQPDLLADFLSRKSVPYNTYFSGVPGKSVSEIQSEADLRDFLTGKIKQIFFPDEPDGNPSTGEVRRPKARFHDILRELRNAVRDRADLNLAEERPSAPWPVRRGGHVMALLGCAMALLFAWFSYLLIQWIWGYGPDEVRNWISDGLWGPVEKLGWLLIWLLGFWAAFRGTRILVTPEARPRLHRAPYHIADEFLRFGLRTIRLALFALGLVLAVRYADGDTPVNQWSGTWQIGSWGVLLVLGLFVLLTVKKACAKPLRRFENDAHILPVTQYARAWDSARVDAGKLVHLIWYLVLLIGVTSLAALVLCWLWPGWTDCAAAILKCGLVLGFYLVAGGFLMLLFKNTMLTGAAVLQWYEDRIAFAPARKLSEHNMGRDHIWAREEHRSHMDQNHFASETLVKSWPRMLYLRLSLFLINVIARFHDNKGKLGGIPTIFSARWLLLDRGHRLVFLTNYIGAWDSYLGEFSDLNAYIGVNAIWTNTYLPLTDAERRRLGTGGQDIGFPTSRFMLFGGACLEQPFKAYVRQSQVETLAWYGAYPGLSVPNIHDNARIRRDLFRTLSTHELDALFRRI